MGVQDSGFGGLHPWQGWAVAAKDDFFFPAGGGVGEGMGCGSGLNCLVIWVSLSSLVVESHWAGMLLSIHQTLLLRRK